MTVAETPEQALSDAMDTAINAHLEGDQRQSREVILADLRAAGWDVIRLPSPTSAATKLGHVERLTRWRDYGDGPDAYCAGDSNFGRDVIALLAECERLHAAVAERQAASAALRAARDRDPPPDTIPVRVRVLVRANGRYAATGYTEACDDDVQDTLWMMLDVEKHCDEVTHTLTAHIPLPRSVEVAANVEVGT